MGPRKKPRPKPANVDASTENTLTAQPLMVSVDNTSSTFSNCSVQDESNSMDVENTARDNKSKNQSESLVQVYNLDHSYCSHTQQMVSLDHDYSKQGNY